MFEWDQHGQMQEGAGTVGVSHPSGNGDHGKDARRGKLGGRTRPSQTMIEIDPSQVLLFCLNRKKRNRIGK